MTFDQLRLKHPRLIYKSYAVTPADGSVAISYEFLLEPDIVFRPSITIPTSGDMDSRLLAPYAFHLGMVEAISYWKAACPREVVVEAGPLDTGQIRFFTDLFLHGLGEFFYRNEIDFTKEDFLRIVSSPVPEAAKMGSAAEHGWMQDAAGNDHAGDLVLVGGGKDSAVTLGLLKNSDRTIQTMVLNPTEASLSNINAAGLRKPIVVSRVIDPMLLALNRSGYLNGHTPFSALLAFLGVTVAAIHGHDQVIVSNEKSADEGNVVYHGVEINHQYSKSFRFEQMFRQYAAEYLSGAASYFSLMRPFNSLQIGMLFTRFPEFHTTFRSCNVGSTTNSWCGRCAKCAFTYLTLSPFLSREQLIISFGDDLLARAEILEHIRSLAGLTPVKPFECVGTRDETKLAVILSVDAYLRQHMEVPEGLLKIKSDMAMREDQVAHLKRVALDTWGDTYNVPETHIPVLRRAWERVKE